MESKFVMNEWDRIRVQLRNKYPELTGADLIWGRTSREDLIQMIATKLDKTKQELIDEITSFEYSS